MPRYLSFVSSLSPPVTNDQNQTLRICPTAVPGRCPQSAAQQPSDAGPNRPETHLLDETFGGEEYAAENCERERAYMSQASVQHLLAWTSWPGRGVIDLMLVTPPATNSKRLNLRAFAARSVQTPTAS